MKFLLFVFLLVSLYSGQCCADERSEWFAERREWIDRAKRDTDPESFENLSRILIGIGRNSDRASPEARDLFEQSKKLLLSTPGHAEYYRDRINEAREKLEHAREHENSSMVAYYRGKWDKAREGFTVMSYLPSVETVKVLGEFLGDERGKIVLTRGYSRDDELLAFIKRPHCYSAMLALQRLPIVEKPCEPLGTDYMPDELEPALKPWQQWYQEIKDGKRTFRFEGDPVEYDLNGPAPKDKVERIARDQKREVERQGGRQRAAALPAVAEQATTSSRSRPVTIALLIASIVLLGSIGFYILRKRRHGARR